LSICNRSPVYVLAGIANMLTIVGISLGISLGMPNFRMVPPGLPTGRGATP
jgi:hypothetical protein